MLSPPAILFLINAIYFKAYNSDSTQAKTTGRLFTFGREGKLPMMVQLESINITNIQLSGNQLAIWRWPAQHVYLFTKDLPP
jgi:hypothetical protein